jgi:hypothetical protein
MPRRPETKAVVHGGAYRRSLWAKAVTPGFGADRLLRASGRILCKQPAVLAGPPPSG